MNDFFNNLQELGLVQKLGDVFSLFPGREEENGHGSSQLGVCVSVHHTQMKCVPH